MVDKHTLRRVYLEKRLFLSENEFSGRNYKLVEKVSDFLSGVSFKTLHTFLSITEKKEVDTIAIIELLRKQYPAVNIAISKTLPMGELSHYWYNDHLTLKKNKWGIPQPVEGEAAEIGTIDVVLVPLIIFDKTGHRIGYGKGYYDRFLKRVPDAIKIGLSLSPPLDNIPYAGGHDIKLDMCITPFGVYRF